MDSQAIMDQWQADAVIDRSQLDIEALKQPQLHQKYYRLFVSERTQYKHLETHLKILKSKKREFYLSGPTEETKALGWSYPVNRKILSSELNHFVEADPDVIKVTQLLNNSEIKVDALVDIVKAVRDRGYAVRNAIDYLRWSQGG